MCRGNNYIGDIFVLSVRLLVSLKLKRYFLCLQRTGIISFLNVWQDSLVGTGTQVLYVQGLIIDLVPFFFSKSNLASYCPGWSPVSCSGNPPAWCPKQLGLQAYTRKSSFCFFNRFRFIQVDCFFTECSRLCLSKNFIYSTKSLDIVLCCHLNIGSIYSNMPSFISDASNLFFFLSLERSLPIFLIISRNQLLDPTTLNFLFQILLVSVFFILCLLYN